MTVFMKTLMICGGTPPSKKLFEQIIQEFTPDCLIAVDHGAAFLFECGQVPDILVGDFDSLNLDILKYYESKCEIVGLNSEKDETDTEIGLRIAHSKNADKIIMLGATGGRLDHTVGNLYLLKKAALLGIDAVMIDEIQKIFIIDHQHHFDCQVNCLVSLLAASDCVQGITTEGFYYPLQNENLSIGDVRGISNVIISEHASVTVESGLLFCIINQ